MRQGDETGSQDVVQELGGGTGKMISSIFFLWIFIQLQAPTWCYVCLTGYFFAKTLMAMNDIIKQHEDK